MEAPAPHVLLGGRFEEQDNTSTEYTERMKGDSRALLDDSVPHCVRRFIWNTAPRKLMVLNWHEWNQDAVMRFRDFRNVYLMRKYDGWFVVLYITEEKKVRWQTMSGFLNSRIHAQMQDFIGWLQELASSDRITPKTAFKIEFVVQNAGGEDCLQLVGRKYDTTLYKHQIVITDFFMPYTPRLDADLMACVEGQHRRARTHKTAPLEPDDWRRLWNSADNIESRLNKARELFGQLPPSLSDYVMVAEVRRMTNANTPVSMIASIARSMNKNTLNIEGAILHCGMDTNATYTIFKLKLEYLGGLSMYYSPLIDTRVALEKIAGRQFVARLLTVECLHGSYIPYRIGVGYWNEAKGRWVVTDSLPMKHDNRQVDGFLRMTGKRDYTKVNANVIAKVLSICKPGVDTMEEDLFQTDHFKKESSPNLLNVCRSGLIVAGSANAVYQSEKGNFHLQAAIVKHVGLTQTSKRRTFTPEEVASVDAPPFNDSPTVLPGSVSTEWSMERWQEMQVYTKFNKSDVLSQCIGGGISLHARLHTISQLPPEQAKHPDLVFPLAATNITFMFPNNSGMDIRVIRELVKGHCFESTKEVDGGGINSTLDVLVVLGQLNREQYEEIKIKNGEDFVILNSNWFNTVRKHGWVPIKAEFLYDTRAWCERRDKVGYATQLIALRNHQRSGITPGFEPQIDNDPPPPKRLKMNADPPTSSRTPLMGKTFFILSLKQDDTDARVNLAMIIENDKHRRRTTRLQWLIILMGGQIEPEHSGENAVVVLYLPRRDLATYTTLLHAKYFFDLKTHVDAGTDLLIDEYVCTRIGEAGEYVNGHNHPPPDEWFTLLPESIPF
jgi:hypothetical protein